MVENYKKAIESLWVARCNISEYEKSRNKYGGIEFNLIEKAADIPCRISYSKISQVNQDKIPLVSQIIKLFITNEITINPGSLIEVIQNKVARKYKHSGVSSVYSNHQEIILDIYEEVA